MNNENPKQEAEHSDEVILKLTKAEALVLFEFCSRFSDQDTLSIVDQAEARALWDLAALLETVLLEPFLMDYREILDRAREQLRDKA